MQLSLSTTIKERRHVNVNVKKGSFAKQCDGMGACSIDSLCQSGNMAKGFYKLRGNGVICKDNKCYDSIPLSKVDWMVGASAATQEFNKEYKIVYADRDYLSFYTKEYSYLGGAHGNTAIRVGTISRATGRILKVGDFVADVKRAALKNALYDGAVKALGGKENLQSGVEVVENFYLAKDGLHFVYNEYEIACYAAGPVEVVIDPKSL